MPDETRVQVQALSDFCVQVFCRLDVPEEDARVTAGVLVAADLRGIASHGVARLRRYVNGLRDGTIFACPKVETLVETPAAATIDAGGGLGQPVSHRAMQKAIQKALETGAGFVTVRNSNHYGIAGYYAMMALEHGCIGMSMTNADVLVVPTFGRNAALGTNPIAVAAPAGKERPFVLDMATSTVPRGKLEVYDRLNKPLPAGWATDERGMDTDDARRVLENFKQRAGGGLLPLGGAGELCSGHKGYGLGLWVEIFCALLSGAAYADLVYPKTPDGKPLPAKLGHFFGAWRVDAFRPLDAFKADMDDLQRRLKAAPKAEGQERIYIHGEKEYEMAERCRREGISLGPKVAADLQALGRELDLKFQEFQVSS
ncbi:MAG: Ldh family oxidoreductase [Thermoflexales bacterium]|nr:Ldh family oxidoreductase [Thermoflexales bacterium]